jgi:hypothetical protein
MSNGEQVAMAMLVDLHLYDLEIPEQQVWRAASILHGEAKRSGGGVNVGWRRADLQLSE